MKRENPYFLVKRKISEVIETAVPGTRLAQWSKYFDVVILTLILLNIFAVIISTVDSIEKKYETFFFYFEFISVVIFSVEYILRVWVCDVNEEYREGKKGFRGWLHAKRKYIFSWYALIDLAAILPFYLPMFIKADLRFIRILRLFRVLRLLKAGRYTRSIKAIGLVFIEQRVELFTTLFLLVIVLFLASSFMYYAERTAQPEAFSSIPNTLWWGVATLTTVGYGDVYPVTSFGKFMAGIIAVLGVGIVALPSGILASGLVEHFEKSKKGELMEGKIQNHIVLCGWNFYGEDIIENLVSRDIKGMGISKILILADLPERPPELELFKEDITFIRGKASVKRDLEKVSIGTARSVLILSNPQHPDPDAEALLSVLSVESLNSDAYTCVQVQDSDNLDHFRNVHADEIICLDKIASGVSVSSAVNHGLSHFLNELLTFNDKDEFYKIDTPIKVVGKTFREASSVLLDEGVILTAVEKDNSNLQINPVDNEYTIPGDSKLIVIAKSMPKL